MNRMIRLWIIVLSTTPALCQGPGASNGPLSVELIEAATNDHRTSPLNLTEPRDPRLPFGSTPSNLINSANLRRGVLLTAYLRFSELSRRQVQRLEAARATELAAPELWIVIFPYSRERARALVGESSSWRGDPSAALDSSQAAGNPIAWPKELLVETTGKDRRVIEPLWVKTDEVPKPTQFPQEWVRRKSIVASYPLSDPAIADRTARITVNYRVEGGPRNSYETSVFWLKNFSDEAWRSSLQGRNRAKRLRKKP